MATQKEVIASQTATSGGRKFDGGKRQYGLVPPIAFAHFVDVLTTGAKKYEPDNWRRVPNAIDRYFDAAMRHMWDGYKAGEQLDPETKKHHLAHAMCCLAFIIDLEMKEKNETIERNDYTAKELRNNQRQPVDQVWFQTEFDFGG